MNTSLSMLCAAGLAAAGATAAVHAQPPSAAAESDVPGISGTIELQFERIDADADGVLTLDEVPRGYALYVDFARWDGNKDGVIDVREFDRYVDTLAQL